MMQENTQLTLNQFNNGEISLFNVDKYYCGSKFKIWYISDIHLEHHIKKEGVRQNITSIVKNIVKSLVDCSNSDILIIMGDIANSISLSEIFYKALYYEIIKLRIELTEVIILLGNHELSEFNTYEEGYFAYKNLFEKFNRLGNEYICPRVRRNFKFLENDYCMLLRKPVYVVGFTGYAQYNDVYNSSTVLSPKQWTRNEEIIYSRSCEELYKKVLDRTTEINGLLIVASHFPIKDWMNSKLLDNHCVYFHGHDHHNLVTNISNCTIYANNQIGYDKILYKNINLMSCEIGIDRNFFADFDNGIHIIGLNDYKEFLRIKQINYTSLKGITGILSDNANRLYMLKYGEYYCFILKTEKDLKILYKGSMKCISKHDLNIEDFYQDFINIIYQIIDSYKPYGNYINRVSNEVKALGFDGYIHGCIVDLNYFNHIMVNPNDGKLTFYYSPEFTKVMFFSSFIDQLKFMGVQTNDGLIDKNSILYKQQGISTSIMKVDAKKGSMYSVSRFVNKLQYAVDKGVLGIWAAD